jgi:hypothetical protein
VVVYKKMLLDPGDQIDVLLNLAEVLAVDVSDLDQVGIFGRGLRLNPSNPSFCQAGFVLQQLRSAMLLRKEVARMSSLAKHEVEFSLEGLTIIRILHFSLATQYAARHDMSKALLHFGYSCDPATCPLGERPMSPALGAYYDEAGAGDTCSSEENEDEEITRGSTAEDTERVDVANVEQMLAAVESNTYRDVIKKYVNTRGGRKITAILLQQQRQLRNQPSASPSEASTAAKAGGQEKKERRRGQVQLGLEQKESANGAGKTATNDKVTGTKWVRRLKEGVSEYNGVYRRYPVENEFHVGIIETDADALAEVIAGREGVDGREGLAGWAGERSEMRVKRKAKRKRGGKAKRTQDGGAGSLVAAGVMVTRLLWSNDGALEWGLQQAAEDEFVSDDRCPYEPPGGGLNGGTGFHFQRDVDMYETAMARLKNRAAALAQNSRGEEDYDEDVGMEEGYIGVTSFFFMGEEYTRDYDDPHEVTLTELVEVEVDAADQPTATTTAHDEDRGGEAVGGDGADDGGSGAGSGASDDGDDPTGSFNFAVLGSAVTAAAAMVGMSEPLNQVSAMLGLGGNMGFKGASGESGAAEWGWSRSGDCLDDETPLRMFWGAIPSMLLGALAHGLRPGSKFHTAAPVPPAVESVQTGMDGRLSHWYFLHRSARNRRRKPRNAPEQAIQYLLALLPEEVEEKVVGAEWWVECVHGPGCHRPLSAQRGMIEPRRRGWGVNSEWTLPEYDGAFTSDFNGTRHLGLPFHYTADRARLERGSGSRRGAARWAHPLLGSVLYISGKSFGSDNDTSAAGGQSYEEGLGGVVGPTIVCNQSREQVLGSAGGAVGSSAGVPRVRGVTDAWVVEPVQGQYLLYRGDLLTAELPSRPPLLPADGARGANAAGRRGELPTQLRLHIAWWGRECKHGKPNKCVRSKKNSDYVSVQ